MANDAIDFRQAFAFAAGLEWIKFAFKHFKKQIKIDKRVVKLYFFIRNIT